MNKSELSLTADKIEVPLEAEKPELSLVLPAYNEGDKIQGVVEKIDQIVRKTGLRYELIVVDDGSVDDTRRNVMNYVRVSSGHVKIVGYGRNRGKGYAVKTGFAHAKGDLVVLIDSDLDIDPGQITYYVKALKFGDMVIASKRHPQSKVEATFMRKILSYGFNLMVKFLIGLKVSDTQAGLKAVRRNAFMDVFPRLTVKRYAFDVELLVLAKLLGLKVIELPVNIRLRNSFSLRDIWRMLLDLLGVAYRLKVLQWYRQMLSIELSKAT